MTRSDVLGSNVLKTLNVLLINAVTKIGARSPAWSIMLVVSFL